MHTNFRVEYNGDIIALERDECDRKNRKVGSFLVLQTRKL